MKTGSLLVALLFAATGAMGAGNRPKEVLAPTPPMGWNSFDSYGVYLHEAAAYANLEAMAVKLKPHGYEFFVIDNGWFGEYTLQEGTIFPAEKHAHDVHINEFGHFQPSEVYFPNGLKPIADRTHELGLKFGVHLMRGIPRKAYEQNLPIKGTDYTARDIANTAAEENCTWCTYCYGVDLSKPGAQEWYDGLIQHIADMGVDMIKYDDIVQHPDEVEAVAKAIAKTGKPILLSLSPGKDASQSEEAVRSFMMGNMLRVTGDVWDNQRGINHGFAAWRKWAGYSKPGFWIDLDMIPFGNLMLMTPPRKDGAKKQKAVRLAGVGSRRVSGFSKPQMFTFITMRALSASPLMMGGDLPTLDAFSLSLITNPEMLACNQNGVMGSLMFEEGGLETWKVEKKGAKGEGWIGVFNRTSRKKEFKIIPEILGLDGSGYTLADVWSDEKKIMGQTIKLNANGVLFVKFEG
jgi:alpha-galactosidase